MYDINPVTNRSYQSTAGASEPETPAVFFIGPLLRASVLAALVAGVLFAAPVHAHKVNVFAFVEGDRVFVEGYFTDGKRAQNSKVEVFGPDGELLVEGETDDDGTFTFDIPQLTELKIGLYAGMGHRTDYTLSESEVRGGRPGGGTVEDEAGSNDGTGSSAPGPSPENRRQGGDKVDPAAVDPVVRRAVGEAIQPVMRSLSELKERRTFSDIVGGIGFIVGVLGVFFYWKARRLSDKSSGPGA